MRRRGVLALGATLGLAGCAGYVGSIRDEVKSNVPVDSKNTSDDGPVGGYPEVTPRVGGSLNGRPGRLGTDLERLKKSNTRWLHAFLDIRGKVQAGVAPTDDPDVQALKRVGNAKGTKLVVSLLWDFKGSYDEKTPANVPGPGSPREEKLFTYATKLLEAIDAPVDIIVLGNEPIWETPESDVTGTDPPVVGFTRNLKDHLVDQYSTGDPTLLLGSFNKLYDEYVREDMFPEFHQQFFEMARNEGDLDGIDLHIHYEGPDEAKEMLAKARTEIPEGTVIATEFSPVWRYDENKDTAIGEYEAGRRFADNYGISADLTAVEYFGVVKDDPRPPQELADFYDAMPWYNVNFIKDMYGMLEDYGVSVSTISLLQDKGMRHVDWTDDWEPFHINFLFQQALIDAEFAFHPHYIDDYRKRT